MYTPQCSFRCSPLGACLLLSVIASGVGTRCALERCYLVSRDSFHKDTRLLRLVPLLKELVKEA